MNSQTHDQSIRLVSPRSVRAVRLQAMISTLPASRRREFEIEAVDALSDPVAFTSLLQRMAALK